MAKNSGFGVLGIDPGIAGALVYNDGKELRTWVMPVIKNGKENSIAFDGVLSILERLARVDPQTHIFLERAVPMAMGSKGAFSYGRGFEAIVIAVHLSKLSMTMVEPARWTKEMHEGINANLKPKARSLIAAQRLYPRLLPLLPTKPRGAIHDGFIDALLIAGYGLRKLGAAPPPPNGGPAMADFY